MVAQSSTEAEYHAINSAAREAVWIRNLMSEIGVELPTIRLYTDSQSCIRMAKNTETLRTKHIGAVYHYIRQEIEAGHVEPIYLPRADNVADGLPKPVNGPEFRKFVGLLGMEGNGNHKIDENGKSGEDGEGNCRRNGEGSGSAAAEGKTRH